MRARFRGAGGCKHRGRGEHLECKYCTALHGPSTGNSFEPCAATRPAEFIAATNPCLDLIVEPVIVEDKDVPRTIQNAMQLMRAGELREGDLVIFGDLKYDVTSSFLNTVLFMYDNDKIFTELDISSREKYRLADLAETNDFGSWPQYKQDDYTAATRLVYMLYAIIDAKQAEDYDAKMQQLQELKVQLESYQQDEDDAAVELADAQRNYDYEKQARVQLEADIELLEKELSK